MAANAFMPEHLTSPKTELKPQQNEHLARPGFVHKGFGRRAAENARVRREWRRRQGMELSGPSKSLFILNTTLLLCVRIKVKMRPDELETYKLL